MKIHNLKNTPALKSTLGEFTRNHMTPQSANIFLKRIWMCSKHPNSVCVCSYKNKWYSSFVYRHPVFCIPSFYLSWYRKCVVMIFQLLVIPLPWLMHNIFFSLDLSNETRNSLQPKTHDLSIDFFIPLFLHCSIKENKVQHPQCKEESKKDVSRTKF